MTSGSNLARAKVDNQAAIERIIYEYGPIARSEVAERLSLTLPTITTNINSLISKGILKEVPLVSEPPQTAGRRARAIDFVADSKYFIGAEIRCPLRTLSITDYRGNVVYCESNSTVTESYDECVDNACEMINRALSSRYSEKISGLGISMPDIIDTDTGILRAHIRSGWYNKNLRADIIARTGFSGPVTVENNVLARAYGAKLFRKDLLLGVPSFAYCYIFSGIACPLIMTDSTMHSTPAGPGEIGYMILEPDEMRSGNGESGILQNLAGEDILIKKSAEAISEGKAPELKKICGNSTVPTVRQILTAQKNGDKSVDRIVRRSVFYLATGLANMDNMVRPASILIEGRVFDNPENREYFLEIFHENHFHLSYTEPDIVFIDFDDYSGAAGACASAIRNDLNTYIP